MIDADAIARMKDGVILINTARGEIIDENALKDALDSKKISADIKYFSIAGQFYLN